MSCVAAQSKPNQPHPLKTRFVCWLLVLPRVNKLFWVAVDFVFGRVRWQISTCYWLTRGYARLFPTTTRIFLIPAERWVDSFISQLLSSMWRCCHPLSPVCCRAHSASRWATGLGFTDLAVCRLGLGHHRIGSSHPRSLSTFLSLIGRLWQGGGRGGGEREREREREPGIMGWDVTHAEDKLNLSLATSQLIENPSEIFKKIKKLIVNTDFRFLDVKIVLIKNKS